MIDCPQKWSSRRLHASFDALVCTADMGISVSLRGKLGPAVRARVGLVARVSVDMVLQMLFKAEALGAHGALERALLVRLVLGVDVIPHRVFAPHPAALVALQVVLLLVSQHVFFEDRGVFEDFAASLDFAWDVVLPVVPVDVQLKARLLAGFPTYLTA